MRRLVLVVLVPVFALVGCAGGAPVADVSEDSLAGAFARWDAAVAADDARGLHAAALELPWHVVRDCFQGLAGDVRERVDAEADAALAALADAEKSEGAPLGVSSVLDAAGSYVESVRAACF